MMLVSAGADTIIQKATTGHVNWGEVAVSGIAGGIGGAGIAARAGLTGGRAAMVAGAASGAGGGALTSAYGYATGPGPHTVTGFVETTAMGTAEGTVLGAAGGGAGHAIGAKIMGAVTHSPSAETMAMGRMMPERVIPYATDHGYGYYKALPDRGWNTTSKLLSEEHNEAFHVWANKKWINYQRMEGKNLVDIGGPHGISPTRGTPLNTSPYYDAELHEVSSNIGRHTLGGAYSTDHQPAWDLR